MNELLTHDRLKKLLHYDQETGVFTHAMTRKGAVAGTVAGSRNSTGYIYITADGRSYRAHRLAWMYVYGEMPKDEIDHINRVRDDNRISNLRIATRSTNNWNQSVRCDNTSGHPGVVWHEATKKWIAKIKVNKKDIYIGRFEDLDSAVLARSAAKERHHQIQ